MSVSVPIRYRLRVKQRRQIVKYAETHGLRPASRHFGMGRHTVRDWLRPCSKTATPAWCHAIPRGVAGVCRRRRWS